MALFTKTIVNNTSSSSYSKVDVTEKRAPTDESVRLLKEMEKAAEDEFLRKFELKDNTIEGLVVQRSYVAWGDAIQVLFLLNGRRHSATVQGVDITAATQPGLIYGMVAEKIAEAITEKLLPDLAITLSGRGR